MAVPFALGRVIDVIYSMDQAKDNTDKKRQFEQNLKTLCMALTGIFVVGKKERNLAEKWFEINAASLKAALATLVACT